ncbi:MAG: hypothetical protein LBI87_05360 [Candidatus Accumulibacter sp.]|jgi:hypothetical protein|nr:hypothetical protein [Accumulibacter sp.]
MTLLIGACPSARFDREYAAWLTEADEPRESFVRFSGELSILNDLIGRIPETRLLPDAGEIHYDTKTFETELIAGLPERGIDFEAHFRQHNR